MAVATGHMQVPTVLLWRFVVALAVMGAVVAVARPDLPRGRAWLHLAVTALLLPVGQFSFVYAGLCPTGSVAVWARRWCSRCWGC